jgi:hypothetical protein
VTPTASQSESGAVADVAERWREAFLDCAQKSDSRDAIREAASNEDLKRWTELLTAVVVQSCQSLGWRAAAKGHRLDLLPQARSEYLGLDVTAFASAPQPHTPWSFPLGVFELENSLSDEKVSYCLWKVACIRSPFAVVMAYRKDWSEASELVQRLSEMAPRELVLNGQSLVLVMGSRSLGDQFPWSFFRFWKFTPTMKGFTKF